MPSNYRTALKEILIPARPDDRAEEEEYNEFGKSALHGNKGYSIR